MLIVRRHLTDALLRLTERVAELEVEVRMLHDYENQAETNGHLRSALAAVTWSDTLEEAHQIADGALRGKTP